jgi:uncharacterized membrane protein YkoI
MYCIGRVAIAALTVLAFARAHGEEPVQPPHAGVQVAHVCLDQSERRAVLESGNVIELAEAMRAVKKRMPGTVVRASLCHGKDGLVYVLTVLAHDGKVARLTVDAVKGTLIGKR